ncbi:zinc-ribbon domain containing protein [Candidatus Peregrinibacteria bacterium]|nr:zinc-ribbon domain containing protein [Candidatus Peregrinibacteria bacterium]
MPTIKCKNCGNDFAPASEDLNFYKKVNVPLPVLCPDCRQQRRLCFRNERILYKRKCDLCGAEMFSMYGAQSPYKVYCPTCWYGDKWDPISYGRDFDFSKPFFEQFEKFSAEVPLLSLYNKKCENCDYCNIEISSKNCYLCAAGFQSWDCYYGFWGITSKNCVDCFIYYECELCYECIDCKHCYNSAFLQDCRQLRDSAFCYDCAGCSNCMFCSNLRNVSYHVFNKPVSKEEFALLHAELNSYSGLIKAKKTFAEFKLKAPVRNMIIVNSENCLGNYIYNCKNCQYCFDVSNDLRDCKYMYTVGYGLKDCMDGCYSWQGSQLNYDCVSCESVFNGKFCLFCWGGVNDLTYCQFCQSSRNLFSCIGLRHKQYCILNKQYSKEEYEKLVPRIIKHMERTAEWGEFFPSNLSHFGYNETVAQDYFPITRLKALTKGFNWQNNLPFTTGKETISLENVPDKIQDAQDSICNEILACESCKRNFKFIPQEIMFYKKIGMALPHLCYLCRHQEKIKLRNPRKLWDRPCSKCGANMRTVYSPERLEIVYCEKCYLREVY